MIILTIRTDKPEAEIGLYQEETRLAYVKWLAHRELSSTIHLKILGLLQEQGHDWKDIEGIVCYKGPGSFTGLRIGLTVANTLANDLEIPIAGTSSDAWVTEGVHKIKSNRARKLVVPEYGRAPHITVSKK